MFQFGSGSGSGSLCSGSSQGSVPTQETMAKAKHEPEAELGPGNMYPATTIYGQSPGAYFLL
jgi:hypothetical protein